MNDYNQTYAIIATVNSLLGEIKPCVRAVDVALKDKTIYLYLYHEGEIFEDYLEDLRGVAIDVESAFPIDYEIKAHIERIDPPASVPEHGRRVYWRKEKVV